MWEYLIKYSADNADFICALLEDATDKVNPSILVSQISSGMHIKYLKNSLLSSLREQVFQIRLMDGCRAVFVRDATNLLKSYIFLYRTSLQVGNIECELSEFLTVDFLTSSCLKCGQNFHTLQGLIENKNIDGHMFHYYCLKEDADDKHSPLACIVCMSK